MKISKTVVALIITACALIGTTAQATPGVTASQPTQLTPEQQAAFVTELNLEMAEIYRIENSVDVMSVKQKGQVLTTLLTVYVGADHFEALQQPYAEQAIKIMLVQQDVQTAYSEIVKVTPENYDDYMQLLKEDYLIELEKSYVDEVLKFADVWIPAMEAEVVKALTASQ